jgi:hypothetical protein
MVSPRPWAEAAPADSTRMADAITDVIFMTGPGCLAPGVILGAIITKRQESR